MAAKSIEEVLREEVEFIHGPANVPTALSQDQQKERKDFNADKRKDANPASEALQPRYEFYRALNQLNRAALCCSGGGIRSATFCLGVIQALAAYNLNEPAQQPLSRAPKPGQGKADDDQAGKAEPPHHDDAAKHAAEPEAPTSHVVERALAPAACASREVVAAAAPAVEPAESVPGKYEALAAGARPALGCFHYLSTVSGGGYIGSWLSSWRQRADFPTVIDNLTRRHHGPDIEPPEISWLRAYSNYLTPRLGIASADSWAAVAIFLRNLVLNWLVIIPAVCLILLALKIIATGGVLVAHWSGFWVLPLLGLGIIFLVAAQGFTTRHRPSRRAADDTVEEDSFVRRDLLWAILSAVAVTIFFSSQFFARWLDENCDAKFKAVTWDDMSPQLTLPAIVAVAGFIIYALGWGVAYIRGCCAGAPLKANQCKGDFFCWAVSGLAYGAIVGLGAYLFTLLAPYANADPDKTCWVTKHYSHLLVPTILGVPWILTAQLIAEIVFVGLTCYEDGSDADREWLGRAAGWLAAAAVAWALTAFLVFAGGYFVQIGAGEIKHQKLVDVGGLLGILSGLVTALLGGSSKTPAKSSSDDQGNWVALASNIALVVVGPIFVAVLVVALSVGLDQLLLHVALVERLQDGAMFDLLWLLPWLGIGFGVFLGVGTLASRYVNINRFSLHALYRNRLTRCYLGASNDKRDPDPFSGFDFEDNLCVNKLWPPKADGDANCLFHVVNIALNVVSTKRLAWQERKAESFTVSPRHCGSAYLGYRVSAEYGGADAGGLSLGTAMAISGAAVSPNMGYHSSPSIALLLTLFNVRLGWWLGNPGKAGNETYKWDGPKRATRLLFDEALGRTTDQSPYVYLSDGGHFENLGLYEMVRRRSRLIVLIDAGCDGEFAFDDLGNAVRKIYIDLGVRITFKGLDRLKNRPTDESISREVRDAAARVGLRLAEKTLFWGGTDSKPSETAEPGAVPYYAVGTIDYETADHIAPAQRIEGLGNGYILYIKPAYHGTETSVGIRSYAKAHPDFPHESTTDQWFTESQFESYRSLGLEIATDIFSQEIELRPDDPMTKTGKLTFQDALKKLVVYTAPAPPPPLVLPPAPPAPP